MNPELRNVKGGPLDGQMVGWKKCKELEIPSFNPLKSSGHFQIIPDKILLYKYQLIRNKWVFAGKRQKDSFELIYNKKKGSWDAV